mgnify:CR=1 FL=1
MRLPGKDGRLMHAAVEIGRRLARQELAERPPLAHPAAVASYLSLRYTLRDGDKVLSTAAEPVADMSYLFGGRSWGLHQGEKLFYEKRMLSRWFAQRFSGTP